MRGRLGNVTILNIRHGTVGGVNQACYEVSVAPPIRLMVPRALYSVAMTLRLSLASSVGSLPSCNAVFGALIVQPLRPPCFHALACRRHRSWSFECTSEERTDPRGQVRESPAWRLDGPPP